MNIKGYAHSVIGGREMNQDSFLCFPERGLFAVADGVGGGLRGEVASKMAVDTLAAAQVTSENIAETVRAAQTAILDEALRSLGDALMGTTLSSLVIAGELGTLCHVGDSRIYLLREGALQQLTQDHDLYDEKLKTTVLASYLGLPPDVHPLQVQRESFPVRAGERLLLCSDGLYRQLTESQIVNLVRKDIAEPQKLVETLCMEAAASSDYSDNVTVVFVELE